MAVVRCEKHGMPIGIKRRYSKEYKELVGYPNTAAICGIRTCEKPGMVWLEEKELDEYRKKQERIFRIPNMAVKIMVK